MKLKSRRIFRATIPVIFAALTLAQVVYASSAMTVGQDEGYSGRVMDKIIGKWRPPPQLKREYRLTARVALDGEGNFIDCKAQKSSGLEALDASACAAARAAAPYGAPPYGMPADLYISFWTGGPQNALPMDEHELGVGPSANMAAAQARAQATNERARANAERAAKATGKKMPGESESTPKEAKKEVKKDAPARQVPKASAGELAQAKYPPEFEKYISRVIWDIRKATFVPADAKPGTYMVTARVECDPEGNIVSSSLLESSGNAMVDKFALQGIKRAKRVQPPPEGLGNTLDLTYPLVRQKDVKKAPKPEAADAPKAPAPETNEADGVGKATVE